MVTSTERRRQTLAILTIVLNELHFGISIGWIAPTINKLRTGGEPSTEPLHLTEEDISWVASVEYVGKIFGCVVSVFLMDTVGRRLIVMACASAYFFLWLGTATATSVRVICCIRFLFGFARGTNNTVNSVYLGEVSSPSLRSVFGTLAMTMYNVGVLAEYLIALYLPYRSTALINTCLGAITIVSVYWLVEPVQFLLLKNRTQQAERNFLWLRGVSELTSSALRDFEKVKENIELERCKKTSYRKIFTSKTNRKSLLVVFLAYTLPDLTGYTTVLTFSSVILASNQLTVYLGALECVVCFVSMYAVSRYNRRFLLISAFSCIALLQACTTVLFYVEERVAPLSFFRALTFVSFAVYICVLELVYPVVFIIRGELFPISMKAIGGCAVIVGNSAVNFGLTRTFLGISKGYGMYANFVLYAVAGLVMVLFAYFYIPETRNKSLTQIQEELAAGVKKKSVKESERTPTLPPEGQQLL